MIDDRLRELERAWRSSGSPEDLLRLTREQVRAGERAAGCLTLEERGDDGCRCVNCRRMRGRPTAQIVRILVGEKEPERTSIDIRFHVNDDPVHPPRNPPIQPEELRKFSVEFPVRAIVDGGLGGLIRMVARDAAVEGVDFRDTERVLTYGAIDPMRDYGRLVFSTMSTFSQQALLAMAMTHRGPHGERSALFNLAGCSCRHAPDQDVMRIDGACPHHGTRSRMAHTLGLADAQSRVDVEGEARALGFLARGERVLRRRREDEDGSRDHGAQDDREGDAPGVPDR